jgi:Zn ribbon nucleic-acid-binding protein
MRNECPIDLDAENGIDRVSAEMACPTCGENDADALIVDADDCDHITCTSCGVGYWLEV